MRNSRGESTSNTADLETSTNLSGQLALSTAQDNIQEFLAGGHRRNLAVKQVSEWNRRDKRDQGYLTEGKTYILPRRLHDGPQESKKGSVTLEWKIV